MKRKLFYPPLRDEFTKYGDRFTKIDYNPANGMYCYRRTISDGSTYYEVFKAIKTKDEHGKTYERYPSSAQFGFGTALCIRGDEACTQAKIAFYMANGFDAGRFKNDSK